MKYFYHANSSLIGRVLSGTYVFVCLFDVCFLFLAMIMCKTAVKLLCLRNDNYYYYALIIVTQGTESVAGVLYKVIGCLGTFVIHVMFII